VLRRHEGARVAGPHGLLDVLQGFSVSHGDLARAAPRLGAQPHHVVRLVEIQSQRCRSAEQDAPVVDPTLEQVVEELGHDA